jgi:MoxR-like ATPase
MTMPQSMLDEITLKPSDAAKALEYLLNAKQPVVLWGEPGVGKSSIVQQTRRASPSPVKMSAPFCSIR